MPIPSYASLAINDGPLIDSWSKPESYIPPRATEMDGGNTRLRRQPGDDAFQLQFDILYTATELATFRNFVKTTLGGGISRFTMRVWTGAIMETKTVQFIQPYSETPQPPGHTQVSFRLKVYP